MGVYSAGITIVGREGKHIDDAKDIWAGPKAQKLFVEKVEAALDALAGLKTGRQLIDAIDESGHTCTIFRGGPKDATSRYDNCAQASPAGTLSEINCSIVPFRPRQRNIPVLGAKEVRKEARPVGTRGRQDPKKAQYKGDLAAAGYAQTTPEAAAELDVVLARVGAPTAPSLLRRFGIGQRTSAEALAAGRKKAASLLGLAPLDLANMAQGTRKITDNEYYKLCFYYYEYLTPGPGIDTCVRCGREIEHPIAGEPASVLLGHELIHAWRMMSGRRVVREGWEEEAMTVGIGMFRNLTFTENRLRIDARLPERSNYKSNGILNSFFGYDMKAASEDTTRPGKDQDTY